MRFGLAILFLGLGLGLPLAAQDDLPDGKGKETLENTCTECHGLDRVLDALRTRERWRTIAVEMRSKGATMTDDELNTLVEYLFQNFGADESRAQTQTGTEDQREQGHREGTRNRASVHASEAAAVVRYREAKGPFRQWRDLTKVEGVEKAKIEANKDRFSF